MVNRKFTSGGSGGGASDGDDTDSDSDDDPWAGFDTDPQPAFSDDKDEYSDPDPVSDKNNNIENPSTDAQPADSDNGSSDDSDSTPDRGDSPLDVSTGDSSDSTGVTSGDGSTPSVDPPNVGDAGTGGSGGSSGGSSSDDSTGDLFGVDVTPSGGPSADPPNTGTDSFADNDSGTPETDTGTSDSGAGASDDTQDTEPPAPTQDTQDSQQTDAQDTQSPNFSEMSDQEVRNFQRNQIESQLEEQLGRNVRDSQIQYTVTDSGRLTGSLTDEAAKQIATNRLDSRIGAANLTTDDVTRTTRDGETVYTLEEEARRMIRTRRAAGSIGGTTEAQRTRVALNDPVRYASTVIGGTTEQQREQIAENAPESPSTTTDTTFNPVENVPEAPSGITGDTTGTQTTSAPDVDTAENRRTVQQAQTESIAENNPQATNQIERRLEEQTGADLTIEDIALRREDGQLVGTLTEQGEETVEVQNTPLSETILGGLTTTGTRVRRDIRSVTDPTAEAFDEATPSQSDVLGFVGATAPVAATEPTIGGEVALGALVGTTAAAGILAEKGNVITGDDPTAETSVGIGTGVTQSELDQPDEPQGQSGELQPGETVQETEIEVPEDRTTVAPEELGIPRDAIREGDAEITGPEGTEITDEGDIVIPAGTTQVAKQRRYEEDEEEEDSDEEEDEEEAEEEEQDRVVVDVPEEFIPDEDVTIGEPEDTTETEETTEEAEEDEADEEQESPLDLPQQGQVQDDAVPDNTQADEDFAERQQDQQGQTTTPEETVEDIQNQGDFGTIIGGGATNPFVPPLLRDETEQTSEVDIGGPDTVTTPFTGGREREDTRQPARQGQPPGQQQGQPTGQADVTVPGLAEADATADLVGDLVGQQQGQADVPQEAIETTEATAQGTQVLTAQLRVQEQQQQQQQRDSNRRRLPDLPDFGFDGEEDDEDDELFGVAEPQLTNFRNPLTGGVLETTADPSDEPFAPGFGDSDNDGPNLGDLF